MTTLNFSSDRIFTPRPFNSRDFLKSLICTLYSKAYKSIQPTCINLVKIIILLALYCTHLSLGNNSFMNSEAAGPELEQPEVVAYYNVRKS